MAQKKNTFTKYLGGLAVAVLLPLSFYFITKALSKDKIKLPDYYVVEGKDANGDTTYHKVGDIALTNQLGEQITTNGTLAGKSMVISLFYTNCDDTCRKVIGNVTMLQKAFRRNPRMENQLDTIVQFVSISTDPVHDTVPALRAYADGFHANHDHWWFLRGDATVINNFVANELHMPATKGQNGFLHSNTYVLVDKNRYVRGYYNGLDTGDVRRCADDIVLLSLEKENRKKHRK
jgi:protein SCO1/2